MKRSLTTDAYNMGRTLPINTDNIQKTLLTDPTVSKGPLSETYNIERSLTCNEERTFTTSTYNSRDPTTDTNDIDRRLMMDTYHMN